MQKQKAIIYQSELDFIERCIRDYAAIETGGDLFGFWSYSGYPVVQYAIGPGQQARRTVSFFQQDEQYLYDMGTMLNERHGLQHIGEWHSHHRLGLAHPSGHDVSTVVSAIKDCHLQKFYLCIGTIENNCPHLNGFMFNEDWGRNFSDVDWVVLKRMSPLRNEIDTSEHAASIENPRTLQAKGMVVSETTLKSVTYVKPNFSQNSWLKTKEGTEEAKKIYTELSRKLGKVNMFVKNDELSMKISGREKNYEVVFPSNYPVEHPLIYSIQGVEKIRITLETEEKENVETLDYILEHIRYFSTPKETDETADDAVPNTLQTPSDSEGTEK